MNASATGTGFSTNYFIEDVHKIELADDQVIVKNHDNPCDLKEQVLRDLFYRSCYVFDRATAERLVELGYKIVR